MPQYGFVTKPKLGLFQKTPVTHGIKQKKVLSRNLRKEFKYTTYSSRGSLNAQKTMRMIFKYMEQATFKNCLARLQILPLLLCLVYVYVHSHMCELFSAFQDLPGYFKAFCIRTENKAIENSGSNCDLKYKLTQ